MRILKTIWRFLVRFLGRRKPEPEPKTNHFLEFGLPLIRRTHAQQIADNIISVQPMNQQTSLIFYLDAIYGKPTELVLLLVKELEERGYKVERSGGRVSVFKNDNEIICRFHGKGTQIIVNKEYDITHHAEHHYEFEMAEPGSLERFYELINKF